MSEALEIGKKVASMLREGKNENIIKEFYHQDIVSVEAMESPDGSGREAKGLEAIIAKNQWWVGCHEVHSVEIGGPFPNGDGDQFAIFFKIDATNKEMNQRMQMEEVGLYTVKDGKIIREEFLYSMG